MSDLLERVLCLVPFKRVEKKSHDSLVHPLTETELLRWPLEVVTVTVYWRPGVRTLKVHSRASQGRVLSESTAAGSTCLRTKLKPSHSPNGRPHRTLRVVSSLWRTTSFWTARGAGGRETSEGEQSERGRWSDGLSSLLYI